MGAKRHVSRGLLLIQAQLGLEPLPGLVHQGDHRDGHITEIGRERGDIVISLFRRGIQDVVFPQGRQALGFVVWYRRFHSSIRLVSK